MVLEPGVVKDVVALVAAQVPLGSPIAVIGGPPCQAFSRSNPFALSSDPRNALPLLYLEIIEELMNHFDVQFILFENVLGIRDKKHATTFSAILEKLEELGLHSEAKEYRALLYGVPQDRRRIIIMGFPDRRRLERVKVETTQVVPISVRQAIGHLPEPAFVSRGIKVEEIPHHPNHWTMVPRSPKFTDPASRIANSRSFRVLKWDKPSPTVAYGHRELHVHPSGHRRVSIYEAMRFQGFPERFRILGPFSAQVEQVSNAVPPPLGAALARAISASNAPTNEDSLSWSAEGEPPVEVGTEPCPFKEQNNA
jgi:DNA (cytosine-5)-methyltransferase 1